MASLGEKEIQATNEYFEHHHENMRRAAVLVSKGAEETPEDNSMFDYIYKRLDLPKDEDGYCVSFSTEDESGIAEFFNTYGVVVVRDILTEEEALRTEDEIWEFISRHSNGVERENPETWEYWPKLKHLGILGNEFILSKQCFENRQNPKLASVYRNILATKEVFVTVGRASAMRPTRDILINGEVLDKPKWKTIPKWVHWDMNPWTGLTTTFSFRATNPEQNRGYNVTRLQGILSCVDCGPKDGGFHCIPGFHNHIRGWANANLDFFPKQNFDLAGSIPVPKDDPILNDVQTVPIRKGSALIWSSCLPHATFPNDSNHGRMIQYIKMARKDDPSVGPIFQNAAFLPDGFSLSPLGKELFPGLQ